MHSKTVTLTVIAVVSLTALAAGLALSNRSGEPGFQSKNILTSIKGFDGPEAVRYDPEQDVWFVSNFGGDASGDSNGFVSKVSADGVILEREFMVGSKDLPFHGGRGMFIAGRSLWVADAEGVHEFDRFTGSQLGFVDLSAFEPGFPNDIVVTSTGDMYVTDTDASRLYKISDGVASIAVETPFPANGITINPANGRLILVPWSDSVEFVEWDVDSMEFSTLGMAPTGGSFDGVEVVEGKIITASQADKSLHIMVDGIDRLAIELPGRPADIGVDTKRMHIAVPYVGRDQVDIVVLESLF
jgi:hypothetical protein